MTASLLACQQQQLAVDSPDFYLFSPHLFPGKEGSLATEWPSHPSPTEHCLTITHTNLNQTCDCMGSFRKWWGRWKEVHGREKCIHNFCCKSCRETVGDWGIDGRIIMVFFMGINFRMWNVLDTVQWLVFVMNVLNTHCHFSGQFVITDGHIICFRRHWQLYVLCQRWALTQLLHQGVAWKMGSRDPRETGKWY